MTAGARRAVGGALTFALVLVAAVTGLVAVVGSAQLRDDGWWTTAQAPEEALFVDPVTVDAEVLDVDGGQAEGWASADVALPTEDGGREVSSVDLGEQTGEDPLPEVGDTIAVVHERGDPTWVVRSDDPVLAEGGGGAEGDDAAGSDAGSEALTAGTEAAVLRLSWVALGSLVLAVLVAAATVVAVRRAPSPQQTGPPSSPAA